MPLSKRFLGILTLALFTGNCVHKQDFPEIRDVQKIEIRLYENYTDPSPATKIVTDTIQSSSLVSFVNNNRHGFVPPLSGGPKAMAEITFYSPGER